MALPAKLILRLGKMCPPTSGLRGGAEEDGEDDEDDEEGDDNEDEDEDEDEAEGKDDDDDDFSTVAPWGTRCHHRFIQSFLNARNDAPSFRSCVSDHARTGDHRLHILILTPESRGKSSGRNAPNKSRTPQGTIGHTWSVFLRPPGPCTRNAGESHHN